MKRLVATAVLLLVLFASVVFQGPSPIVITLHTTLPTPERTIVPRGEDVMVWISETGAKFHDIPDCGSMREETATQMPLEEAWDGGYERCKNCFPPDD